MVRWVPFNSKGCSDPIHQEPILTRRWSRTALLAPTLMSRVRDGIPRAHWTASLVLILFASYRHCFRLALLICTLIVLTKPSICFSQTQIAAPSLKGWVFFLYPIMHLKPPCLPFHEGLKPYKTVSCWELWSQWGASNEWTPGKNLSIDDLFSAFDPIQLVTIHTSQTWLSSILTTTSF